MHFVPEKSVHSCIYPKKAVPLCTFLKVMKIRRLIWLIPTIVVSVVVVLVLALVGAATYVLVKPEMRHTVLRKGIVIANDKTDFDIDLGRIYLSPFHHSPKVLVDAYKGEGDLPLQIEIDSLFVGHRGQDTLVYVHSLYLKANVPTSTLDSPISDIQQLLALPISVERLYLDGTTFHSDSMIASVGVDAIVGLLDVVSPELCVAKGQYPLHGLRLSDVEVGIDLRPTPPDTTAKDTKPLLLAFDVQDGLLRNIHFALTPLGMHIRTARLATDALVDVGANLYDARRLEVENISLTLGSLYLPFDTLYGDAKVNLANNAIISNGLHVRSSELQAAADLSAAEMDLEGMRVAATGQAAYRHARVQLDAQYGINDESYELQVQMDSLDLSPFLGDSTRALVAGTIEAQGKGINPAKPMRSAIGLHLTRCVYDQWNLSGLQMDFSTDSATSVALALKGLELYTQTPMPLFRFIDRLPPFIEAVTDSAHMASLTSLSDLTVIDTIRHLLPPLAVDIALRPGSPLQPYIDRTGLAFNKVDLSLASDSAQTGLTLDASLPEMGNPEDSTALRLPAVNAALRTTLHEGVTAVSLKAHSRLTDGAMNFHNLRTDADVKLDVVRTGNALNGTGCLAMDSLSLDTIDLGSRSLDIAISPSESFPNAIRADVETEDLPLDLVTDIVRLPDIDIRGAIRAKAAVDGLPYNIDLSAEVLPLGVAARYKPYDIALRLGETPIVMKHNRLHLNHLPIYAVDSTFIAFSGGLDLDSMKLDITIEADSFAPVKLPEKGPIPVYGDLATDIHGRVTGPLDSIVADVSVTLLPVTDITYPISKKNLAQVKPHGTVNVHYDLGRETLLLGGRINVDDGFIRYSPKAYPIMPFHVDSGSHVAFNGPIGQTMLDVSASQKVKADVQSEDEETRRVNFTTGVRVQGTVDSIGINSIGFFLEAPDDETITHELETVDEETREGLAATLLATGMYVGESNVAAQRGGYALSSIVNSRLNAAMTNSKIGKIVDIDFSTSETEHVGGTTNDMNIAISRSFFKERLRITLGSTFTDNPDVNKASGLLSSITADYKLTPQGNLFLRAFSQRDFNNILEGDLFKSGLGLRFTHQQPIPPTEKDTIRRTLALTGDVDIAWRSNNSLGPNLTLNTSIRNLLGKGEIFSIKPNFAYYWALRKRHPGDPKKTDTYKAGISASLIFPYLHWGEGDHPEGDTRYMVGYQYENIAGGYGVHKVSASLTYFIRTSQYVTHAFTPFSLSVVRMNTDTAVLIDKAAQFPQLLKILAGDEFVPAIAYSFIYDNYRSKRVVNTALELGVKESGNLINAIYWMCGYNWNTLKKPFGKITFNQFVKLTAELRNKFNITDRVCIATRLFAGANIPLGNSKESPLSEAFYAGGPNNMRACSPYAYGPGNFYSEKYNQNFFHAGDVKLEANFELRFPIVWKLYGATFLDAGNVWSWYCRDDELKKEGILNYVEQLQLRGELHDGILNNKDFAKQIALGTGLGLRLDFEGLVVRLDFGVAIHAPYQTYRYTKDYKPDYGRPINTYFNIPSFLDAVRINFGIGYPF